MGSDMKYTTYILFYISTLFMPIIMLNLLIAIIGDSYEKIKSAELEVLKFQIIIRLYKKI